MKRIYNDDGRMVVPALDQTHEVAVAMAKLNEMMLELRKAGYSLIDIQTLVARTACDTTRDMATHGF